MLSAVISRFKSLTKRLPFPVFLRFFYATYLLREVRRDRYWRKRLGLLPLSSVDLSRHKHSDTLVILASGASINEISAERWRTISQFDTIGFNYWVIHPFIPKMYFVEAVPADKQAQYALYRRFAEKRSEAYSSVLKVITELRNADQGEVAIPEAWKGNFFTLYTLPATARSEEEFSYSLGYLRRVGLFKPTNKVGWLFKQANTVSSLIGLAARMGYRNVVLCGVDLTNSEYFYQDSRLFPETAEVEFVPRAAGHSTNTPLEWRISFGAMIKVLRREVLEPAGISIFVENRSSALWPEVPEVDFDSLVPRSEKDC